MLKEEISIIGMPGGNNDENNGKLKKIKESKDG